MKYRQAYSKYISWLCSRPAGPSTTHSFPESQWYLWIVFPPLVRSALCFSWRVVQPHRAVVAWLLWPTRPSVGPCTRGSSAWEEPLFARSQFRMLSYMTPLRSNSYPWFWLRSYTSLSLYWSDIFSRSRPAEIDFPSSLLLHAKPAIVHHVCGLGLTWQKIDVFVCDTAGFP